MSDPIAHKSVDLYVKVGDKDVIVATLEIPVYVDLDRDKYTGVESLPGAMRFSAHSLQAKVYKLTPDNDRFRSAEDALRTISESLESELNR